MYSSSNHGLTVGPSAGADNRYIDFSKLNTCKGSRTALRVMKTHTATHPVCLDINAPVASRAMAGVESAHVTLLRGVNNLSRFQSVTAYAFAKQAIKIIYCKSCNDHGSPGTGRSWEPLGTHATPHRPGSGPTPGLTHPLPCPGVPTHAPTRGPLTPGGGGGGGGAARRRRGACTGGGGLRSQRPQRTA